MDKKESDIPVSFAALATFVARSPIAISIVATARDLGVGIPPTSSAAELLTACKLVGIKTIGELGKELVSLKPDVERFFAEFFFRIRRGARASDEHLLAMTLVGANGGKVNEATLAEVIEWPQDYVHDILLAARVFGEAK